MEDGNKNGTPV